MSLRRSSRRSSSGGTGTDGGGADKADVRKAGREANRQVVPNKMDTNQSDHGGKDTRSSTHSSKRLFVGDSVEFCSNLAAHAKMTALKSSNSTANDFNSVQTAKEMLANADAPNFNYVQTASTTSTDPIVSSSISSTPNTSNRSKRSSTLLCASSSSSFASVTKEEQPTEKKMCVPLFKHKLFNIQLQTNSEAEEAKQKTVAKGCSKTHCNREKQRQNEKGGYRQIVTTQQLLSLAKARTRLAQSNLTLSQLKQQAREKNRANSKAFRQVQLKKKRNKRNGRYQTPKLKAPASGCESKILEPVEKVEMNTGVLFLFRGENPRAKFVRST